LKDYNDELKMMWMDAVEAYFKVLGGAEEIHKTSVWIAGLEAEKLIRSRSVPLPISVVV
jgi:hypothetical protein